MDQLARSALALATPIASSAALLAPPARANTLARIDHLSGLPRQHFERLYCAAIERFASFSQQLPASEAHHHAYEGGLLDHTLETIEHALTLRQGHLLPTSPTPESDAQSSDLWTYAVFTAALLHDIGKILTAQTVMMVDALGTELGPWNPYTGPMLAPATHYRLRFTPGRRYSLHERVAPLLVPLVIPAHDIAWLSTDQSLLGAWLATLGGDHEHSRPLGELIREADRISVAKNLSGGATVPHPTPGAVRSLAERFMAALRHLLDEGRLPINRPGAAGWLHRDDLWLVVKRALDTVRDEMRLASQHGIPAGNDRLMDELQAAGVLMARDGRAVWSVELESPAGWRQTLTVLRLPSQRIWPNPETRPQAWDGSVKVGEISSRGETEKPAAAAAGEERAHEDARSHPDGRTATATPSEEVRASPPDTEKAAAPQRGCLGWAFLSWLAKGIAGGSLALNSRNARLHRVPEGLLLVSPGIFRDFDSENWLSVQRRFQRLRLHEKTPEGTNICIYRVNGGGKQSVLKGFVLRDPETILELKLPEPNSALVAQSTSRSEETCQ